MFVSTWFRFKNQQELNSYQFKVKFVFKTIRLIAANKQNNK